MYAWIAVVVGCVPGDSFTVPGPPELPEPAPAPVQPKPVVPQPEPEPEPPPFALCVNEIAPKVARSAVGGEWLELFAPGPEPVSLLGWTLGEDPLPDVELGPGAALILTGDDLPVTLDADGDTVELKDPGGRFQRITWGPAGVDRVAARRTDCCAGDDCWTWRWLGTPGEPNGVAVVGPATSWNVVEGRVPVEWTAGTWSEVGTVDVAPPTPADVALGVRFDVPEAVAGYTLTATAADGLRVWVDGVEVVRTGLPSGTIDDLTVPLQDLPVPHTVSVPLDPAWLRVGENVLAVEVRAVPNATAGAFALHLDGPGSAPVAAVPAIESVPDEGDLSDVVFDLSRIHEVSLELGQEAFDTLEAQVGVYVDATVSFDGIRLDQVSVKRRGKYGSLRPMSGKPKLRIDLDRVVADTELFGLEAILLDNAVQDCAFVKMPVAFEAFRIAGNPAPRSGYAHFTVNGVDYGLYYLTEEISDRFAERAFGDADAGVFDGSYLPGGGLNFPDFWFDRVSWFDQENGDDTDLAALEQVVATLDAWQAGTATYTDVGAVLDWTSWHGHLAAEEWGGHVDGYLLMPNNYWLVLPPDGLVHVIAWDTDQAFLDDDQWFTTTWRTPAGRIASMCWADPECAAAQQLAMGDLLDGLDAAPLDGLLDRVGRLSYAATVADPKRECDVGSVDAYRSSVAGWLATREATMRAVWGL